MADNIQNNGGATVVNSEINVDNNSTVINSVINSSNNATTVNTELQESKDIIESGTVLLDKYTIVELLNNVSGEADLYVCESNGTKYVAKIYRREIAIKQEVIEAVKNIKSPYVARLFDTGTYNGKPFEILPYYNLGSLQGKTFSFEELKKTIIPCLNEALHELHGIGVIHKDLKPSNMMLLDNNKGVAIIDFGISSVIHDGRTVLVTKTGMTPEYSAPETFRNVFLEESDYYSMGITLYELFCGVTPYSNMNAEEITRYMSVQRIPFPDNMPTQLKDLILGLTYSDLTNRNDTDNPNRRWTYNEVSNWCDGKEQIVPGEANGMQSADRIPGYKFNKNTYVEINELFTALASEWNKGKKELYRGLLSGFFKSFDPEFAGKCMDAEEAVSKDKEDEDIVFWNLIYNLAPNVRGFYWKTLHYKSLKDMGEDVLSKLRANDNSNKKLWDEVLENHLLSSFMNMKDYDKKMIKAIDAIESSFGLHKKDWESTTLDYFLLGYTLSGSKVFKLSDQSFSSIDMLAEYLKNVLEKSFDEFTALCKTIVKPDRSLDPQFEAWLISQGKKSNITKWKKEHLKGNNDE